MSVQETISSELKINRHYIRTVKPNKALCMVHDSWLQSLIGEASLPKEFLEHATLNEIECAHALNQPSKIQRPWKPLIIYCIPKMAGTVARFPKWHPNINTSKSQDLNYSQLLHYITETNFKNLWKEAFKKYNHSSMLNHREDLHYKLQEFNDAVRESFCRLYNSPHIVLEENLSGSDKEILHERKDCHENILSAICTLESKTCFYILQPFIEYTLYDCLTFSPAIFGNSFCKPLFVVYQLLHALRDLHDRGLFMGDFSLHDIRIDINFWVYTCPVMWDSLSQEVQHLKDDTDKSLTEYREYYLSNSFSGSLRRKRKYFYQGDEPFVSRDVYLNVLVEEWVHGEISNYDYLMELNYLAGRQLGNPAHHPVLPWVMDFTCPNGGWRDLARSKYRLNKGDKQLDMTFESLPAISTSAAVNDSQQVPHHVSDVLSEITFYVYMARRTPRSVLCSHVRPLWVPAEYPSSMQRMQEWTPDECIPQFFTDPSIFKSIHPDLPDLEVPWWATDPIDFIQKHRGALESDHVSERLYHWIDLTFGYKLSGTAAVKSKNVCLHLVDQHTSLSSSGVVQLFHYPHPQKLAPSPYLGRHPPKIYRIPHQKEIPKREKENDDYQDQSVSQNKKEIEEDNSVEQIGRVFNRQKSLKGSKHQLNSDHKFECNQIHLLKDYNPVAALVQLEALYNFSAKTMHKVPTGREVQNLVKPHTLHQRKMRDMISLGCVIVEIFMAFKLRALKPHSSLQERYEFIVKLLQTDFHDLPRCVRHAVKLLLQLDFPENEEVCPTLPQRYPAITTDGLPPPSAHQLLQPLIRLFPFPMYFQKLYNFLCQIKGYRDTIIALEGLNMNIEEKDNMLSYLAEVLVKMTACTLPKLLPTLNPEAIDVVLPYLQELFENSSTSVLAAWYLLDPVGQVLGPQKTVKLLLPSLTRLYDSDAFTVKSLKLFHRSYLLQLIVRLGLHMFLRHFTTRLIEAVGGDKDCISENSERPSSGEMRHKTSHLHSPESENLLQDNDDNVLSPFDEDSSQTEALIPSNKSETKSDTEATDLDPETEPEVFMFEVTTEDTSEQVAKTEIDVDLMDHLEQKFTESSDSASADGASLGDGVCEGGRSPVPEEFNQNDNLDVNDASLTNVPSSVPRAFAISIPRPKSDSFGTYSSSVPNFFCSSPVSGRDETLQDNTLSVTAKNTSKSLMMLSPTYRNEKQKLSIEYNISDVAMESVIWLSHRLGPVLTAKHLSRNLLRMLGLCYYGHEQLSFTSPLDFQDDTISVCKKLVAGDLNAAKVLECLSSIAALYGEQLVLLQYFPHVTDLVSSCKRRMTVHYEAGLVGSMLLLKHIIPFLSDATLMDYLQDCIIRDILYPTVRLIATQRLSFPNGGHARKVIAFKLLDVLYLIGLRIGFEMTRKHLTHILQRFFASFDRVHSSGNKMNFELSVEMSVPPSKSPDDSYLNIKKDSETNEYSIGTPVSVSELKLKVGSLSPPANTNDKDTHSRLREETYKELVEVFTPEMAYTAYVPFCKLAGGIHMEQSLRNDELIRRLCVQYDEELSLKDEQTETTIKGNDETFDTFLMSDEHKEIDLSWRDDEKVVSSTFGKNVAMIGNRIDIQLEDESIVSSEVPVISSPPGETNRMMELPKCDISKIISKKMENNQRHLKGNWLAYWEHELGRNEKDTKFNFKQIKLQTFTGHSNSIRSIHALDNENSFISASKDKTVKLWSLRSHGDGTAYSSSQWTYTYHRKSVFAVTFLESLRLAVSCDSTIHLWDPFMGSCIKQFDSTKNSPVTVLTAMPAPSSVVVTGTTEATIRFLDVRTQRYMHEYKVSIGPAGLIRCITVSPNGNWLAVGHSSGVVSILDVRTGLMSGSWKGHEGEVLQIKAFNNYSFVTSSLDYCVNVWNADDGKLICNLRGPTEPVHCINFYKSEMISGTTANRIGVHTSVDSQASFSSTRLRSDAFKGVLTSLTVLPLNRLLLLGADNGTIRLLC